MGKGISLCIPDDDNFYNVELRPFDVKFVVFRQSYQVMKESLKLGYNSVLGDDTIVATVQSSGKRLPNRAYLTAQAVVKGQLYLL